jgi:ring-1,2-phenylacetyl-CoA epoxidase subunit PaaE
MSRIFHRLVIERAWDTTPRARAAQLRVPEHLSREFAYRAGQHIQLRAQTDSGVEEPAYSLCSSPEAGEPLTIAVKRSEGSSISGIVQSMLVTGATIEVSLPNGTFGIAREPDSHRTIILVAGGSGIAPLLSISKTVLLTEPHSRVVLIDANTSAEEIMFAAELTELSKAWQGRLVVEHVLESGHVDESVRSGRVHQGRVTIDVLSSILAPSLLRDPSTQVLLCGPSAMIDAVSAALEVLGVAPEHIHFESFSSTAPSSPIE